MITTESILNKIHEKLIYLTGNEYILLGNIKEQISLILKSYNDAYSKMTKKKWEGHLKTNDILKKFYLPNNTLLERIFLKDSENYPSKFRLLDELNFTFNGLSPSEYENISKFFELFRNFLELENLKNIQQFYVNFFIHSSDQRIDERTLINKEKSIKDFKLKENWFVLKLFLITHDKILILEQNANELLPKKDNEWSIKQFTHEFIIEKDIKQVSTYNNLLVFHNSINSSYNIFLENIQNTIELRQFINDSRLIK